ncbi:hypothetical protein ACWCQN_15395 [Streptomyces sp. NPDC001984]|uniref:hypothetical protein n=1 Tax=Streptomyces sp. NPDC002619 TaxID=3364655 RepID=UPI00367B2D89
MPAVGKLARIAAVVSIVCVPLFVLQPAYAGGRGEDGSRGETEQNANSSDDGTVSVTVGGVVFDRSKNGSGNSTGALTPTTSWTPPACWYAPKYTPDQLKNYLEPIWQAGSTGDQWDLEQRNRYVNGQPYKDFNKDKADDGYWWDSYVDESFPPGWDKCDKPIFWVDKGDPPPANIKNAVTPEILAELAYNEIRVPGTKVTLAPANTTKVNLPTWAWLDAADFKPVSVTASVPAIGISATATAEPISLKIDPGTSDAVTYPASGVCGLNGSSIGEPYAKGKADRTPPCGVKYLRSSGNGSYPLKATVTWKITWTGTGGAGGRLDDGMFGANQDVVVQEIQAVNR